MLELGADSARCMPRLATDIAAAPPIWSFSAGRKWLRFGKPCPSAKRAAYAEKSTELAPS